MPEASCDIALIGLAVMGQNLVLNMNDHGFKVAVFNRTVSKVDEFLANEAKGTKVVGAHSIEELAGLLKRPRRVMLMVKAGASVDQTIDQVLPYLEAGDIIIDGGNSLFTDSNRRTKDLAAKGILFIGTGVSGGEEGARFGPSIMPGGNATAWPHVKPIFQAIAAKDLEKTLSFYAPDARYLSAGRPAAATPQERRKLWMEDYGLPGFSSDEATTEIEVARSGELAFQRGTYVSTAQTEQGKILRSTGKFLVIWKKTPTGGWQAIVDIDNADQ